MNAIISKASRFELRLQRLQSKKKLWEDELKAYPELTGITQNMIDELETAIDGIVDMIAEIDRELKHYETWVHNAFDF